MEHFKTSVYTRKLIRPSNSASRTDAETTIYFVLITILLHLPEKEILSSSQFGRYVTAMPKLRIYPHPPREDHVSCLYIIVSGPTNRKRSSALGKIRTVTPRISLCQRAAFKGGGEPGNLLSLRSYEEKVRTVTRHLLLRSVLRKQVEFEGREEPRIFPRAFLIFSTYIA